MPEPSLRVTHVHRSGARVATTTQYISGRNKRFESSGKGQISNRDLRLGFEFDLDKKTYTAFPANQFGSPKWLKPISNTPLKKSGRTTYCHIETIDTGERKEWFGREARHVVTKWNETREGQTLRETESDGWYIEPPAAWLVFNPRLKPGATRLVVGGTPIDDFKITYVGEPETGFPIFVKRKSKSFHQMPTGERKLFEHTDDDEVTEFSEAPLERSLFVPPPAFRRVAWLDNLGYRAAYRLRLRWEFLKASLTLSHKIADYVR